MGEHKTLLQKYDIPVHHLDFKYIEDCKNARELEKIVQILRSGEEGYYPDLTKCAEQRLKQLKPDSKLFRYEERILGRDSLGASEWQPIYEWTHDIKAKDTELLELNEAELLANVDLAPLRQTSKIIPEKKSEAAAAETSMKKKLNERRIKSTDYAEWDKYDPDVEVLKMDLEDDRKKDEIESKNRLIANRAAKATELTADEQHERKQIKKLTLLERENLAEEHRICGNEYFRAKEYESAIKEYSRAIIYDPLKAARAYNNRAIAQMKLQNYLEAINDCQQCLKQDPNNFKALLRLAESNHAQGRRREAYELYLKILEIDPEHMSALKAVDEIRTQLGDLPPPTATRLQIQEVGPIETKKERKIKINEKTDTVKETATKASVSRVDVSNNAKPATKKNRNEESLKLKEYDLAELIKPTRLIKSKLTTAAEAFTSLKTAAGQMAPQEQQKRKDRVASKPTANDIDLSQPTSFGNARKSKTLIEEL